MNRLLRRPGLLAATVITASAVGFLLAGWLANVSHLLVSWRDFDDQAALAFLAAFAQLVVAAAIWYQIRTASDHLAEEQRQAAHAQRDRQDDIHRLEQMRVNELVRARQTREAEAIVDVVSSASNASALYAATLRPLRTVIATNGTFESIDLARSQLATGEIPRQAAHAARYRVRALSGESSDAYQAVWDLVRVVDGQRSGADAVIRWATNPRRGANAPDPHRAVVIPDQQRDRCLELVGELISATSATPSDPTIS